MFLVKSLSVNLCYTAMRFTMCGVLCSILCICSIGVASAQDVDDNEVSLWVQAIRALMQQEVIVQSTKESFPLEIFAEQEISLQHIHDTEEKETEEEVGMQPLRPEPLILHAPKSIPLADQHWRLVIGSLESYAMNTSEMTYCSMLAKVNLMDLTGLEASHWILLDELLIPQWDAVDLIMQWKMNGVLEHIQDAVELRSRIQELAYEGGVLFDLYLFTSYQGSDYADQSKLSEKNYYQQWHRVVVIHTTQDINYVLDPLRGEMVTTAQDLDVYLETVIQDRTTLYLSPIAYHVKEEYRTVESKLLQHSGQFALSYQSSLVEKRQTSVWPYAQTLFPVWNLSILFPSMVVGLRQFGREDVKSLWSIELVKNTSKHYLRWIW